MRDASARRGNRSLLIGAVAVAVVAVGFGACVAWAASSPEDGTDAAGMAIMSFGMLTLFAAAGSVTCVALYLWGPKPAVSRPPVTGWYADPSGEPQWRYWNGSAWTDFTA